VEKVGAKARISVPEPWERLFGLGELGRVVLSGRSVGPVARFPCEDSTLASSATADYPEYLPREDSGKFPGSDLLAGD
jgi:hypothetical protein